MGSDFLKVSTAIIGLGKIGLTYDFDIENRIGTNQILTHCRSVSLSDFFEITYLIDPRESAIQLAVQHYGGVGFRSLLETTGLESPHFVILSVPTSLQLEMVQQITKVWNSGVYLIEKPFGSCAQDARQMRDALEVRGAKVYVNYMRRYLPNFVALKSSDAFKNRGHLNSVVINGYGTLENIFSHFFDLLIFFESSSVFGMTHKHSRMSEPGNLRFIDSETGVLYELQGVGQRERECSMELKYDALVLKMTSNGGLLEIYDLDGNQNAVYGIDNSVFNTYQAIVLRHIAENFESSAQNTSVYDAIKVHEFIESI